MDNPQEITVLSLCSGYGGLELGLSRAIQNPLRVVAVEVEAYSLANLVAKAEEGKLAIEAMYPDLRTFPAERFSGCFDFILAGYPCQPFATAGNRKGKDDPRHLWPYIRDIIETIEPLCCFFENVRGHLTLGYPDVYRGLRNLGFQVEQGIFSAAESGATHLRERLFILASYTEHNRRVHLCMGDSRILAIRQNKTEVGCKNWDTFELVNGVVAPEKWKLTGESDPRPLFLRDVDGSASEMDRLRLLGNGVVPQQAELAFRALYSLYDARSRLEVVETGVPQKEARKGQGALWP